MLDDHVYCLVLRIVYSWVLNPPSLRRLSLTIFQETPTRLDIWTLMRIYMYMVLIP